MTKFHSLIGILFLFSFSAHAEIITLPSEQEINVEEYGNTDAKYQVLWMHSERGISAELQKTVLNISKTQDIRVLMPDWLDSYFITPSRSSLEKIPQQDFEDLITHYVKNSAIKSKKLFIVSNSRTAGLVLNATHHLQTKDITTFGGIILISPYLRKQTPEIGKSLDYQKIASFSNLPLYVFQAERSPRFMPLPRLLEELEKGGSPVFTHILKDISGGFHARDLEDLTERDLKAKVEFPKQIANALFMLEQTEAAPLQVLANYEKNILNKKKMIRLRKAAFKTPELSLNDIENKPHRLSDYTGKTILVSFWASWCRPCIEEMPSLVKLKEKYKDKLEILAVNVREDKATINKFTQAMKINFPLLQDHDSSTTEDWKVYVYPSNFIIDSKGKLRYAATGAMNWQDDETESILESLF